MADNVWVIRAFGVLVAGVLMLTARAHADAAAPVFEFHGENNATVTHFSSYLIDDGGELDIEAAAAAYAAGQFQQVSSEFLDLGVRDTTLWVALPVKNESKLRQLFIELRNPRLSYVDYYYPNPDGGFLTFAAGAARSFYNRPVLTPMPAFPLRVPPGETQTCFLRIQNTGAMQFRLWAWRTSAFYDTASTAYHPEMIAVGVIICLAAFHLIVFLSLREISYLHLSLFLWSWLLMFMALNGTGPMLLWPDSQLLGERGPTVFTLLMCASFTLFSLSLLEIQKHAPLLHRVSLGWAIFCIAAFFYSWFGEGVWRILICTLIAAGTCTLSILMGLAGARKGNRNAFLFLSLWGIVLIGMFGLSVVGLYRVSPFIFGGYALNFVMLLCVVLWSLELTGRVKLRVQEQRRILEEMVTERTRELREALEQVKTLRGLLPMCSSCKRIRDDGGHWNSVEHFVTTRTYADFTHGICPECCKDLYPGLFTDEELADPNGPIAAFTPAAKD